MLHRLDRAGIEKYARRSWLNLTESELDEYEGLVELLITSLDPFEADEPPFDAALEATRRVFARPPAEEDPYNAIVRRCRVQARDTGPLAGVRIGVKDSMSIAGLPMTCGSRLMKGYHPERDSVLVERLLEAGGEIVAILNMDSFALSGGGETSDYGATLNPVDPTKTAGGSSGGSGAALYYDGIDLTFGTDQGGSIRLPAGWCGVLGHKPTFGLVPYTGITSLDPTFDHVGPMAREVRLLALAMDVISGPHPSDSRQAGVGRAGGFVDAVADAPDGYDGVTVGVLVEGMGDDVGVDDPTREATLEAVERMRSLGATVKEISVPEHLSIGAKFGFALFLEGQMATIRAFGNGHGREGRYWTDFAETFGRNLKVAGEELPPTVKVAMIIGAHLSERYHGSLYARAMNLRPVLRAAYDAAFAEVDVLAMPSATIAAHEHLPDGSMADRVMRGWSMLGNTAPFNMTGHPSLSIPAGRTGDLPVGLMLTAPHLEDARLLSLARTYEQAHGWYPRVAAAEPVGAANVA